VPDRVRDICEAEWPENQNDCSAFVRAVADRLGISLNGQANDIVDHLRADASWRLLDGGHAAASSASAGALVVGGLRGDQQFKPSNHGHVVVVVAGPLAHDRYPSAYWGRLGGGGAKFETINWAWTEHDRDRVIYAAHDLDIDGE
jgi:hypothetical protein